MIEIKRNDFEIMDQIVTRALVSLPEYKRMDAMMDLMNAHKDIPLDLQGLLDADIYNFMHDIIGIHNHLNRRNGRLENGFCPRYAIPQTYNASVRKAFSQGTVGVTTH